MQDLIVNIRPGGFHDTKTFRRGKKSGALMSWGMSTIDYGISEVLCILVDLFGS